MKKRRRKLDRLFDPRKYEDEMRLREEKLAAFMARMAESRMRDERRLTERLAGIEARREEARARAELLRASREKRFPRKKPRKDEGGEPVPVMPRPKPKPLEGGAAAPIEREPRKKVGVSIKPGRSRIALDVDSRQNL